MLRGNPTGGQAAPGAGRRSPPGRFGDRASPVHQARWELRALERVRPDGLRERGYLPQSVGQPTMGIQHANREAEPLAHHADRLHEVRVVGDDDGDLEVSLEGVHEQVGSEVDIRALLFGLDDLDGTGPLNWRVGQGHASPAAQEVAVVDREAGDSTQRANISLLPLALLWVAGTDVHERGEVADPVDGIPWQ